MVGAGLLERIRVFRAVPAPVALPAQAEARAPELGDGDLEQVVGGLERVWVPGALEGVAGV